MIKRSAFTIVELLVALVISTILISITVSTYTLFRRSMGRDQSRADLSQNGRIAFDRLARELRQTNDVVTVLPSSTTDSSVTQPGEIEFYDGHANDLTYRRYYVSSSILKLEVKEYYFASDPSNRVTWNAEGNGGATPVAHVISTQDVADNIQSVAFYGDVELQVILTAADTLGQQFRLRTSILRRN